MLQEVYIVRDEDEGSIKGVYASLEKAETETCYQYLGYLPLEREQAIIDGKALTHGDKMCILAHFDIDKFEVEE